MAPDPAIPTSTGIRPGLRTGDRLLITRGDQGEHVLTGEIDQTTARMLREHLNTTVPERSAVTIDLCSVLYLQSAGVAVLFDQADRNDLCVRVRPGTAVASVIRMCGMDHVATVELVPAPTN
jgi:anti-sigma B factor antagonist